MGDTMREAWLPEPALRAAPVDQDRWPFPKVGYFTEEQMCAAHEAGRQLGMEQARAEPITVYQLCAAHTGRAYSIGVTVPAATHRICPLCESIHTPPAGDSDTQS